MEKSEHVSAEWTAKGENRPHRPKTQISAGKVMASIFWKVRGISFINYLEKERTINSEYFMALFVRSMEEMTKKFPQIRMKKVLFY